MESNFRITHLHVFKNLLTELEPDVFHHLKYLQVLNVHSNKLENYQKTIRVLRKLKDLENLELENNPLTKEANYRLKMIYDVN